MELQTRFSSRESHLARGNLPRYCMVFDVGFVISYFSEFSTSIHMLSLIALMYIKILAQLNNHKLNWTGNHLTA